MKPTDIPEYSPGFRSATSGQDPLDEGLGSPRDPGRGVAEGPLVAAVVREARGLARCEGQIDNAAGGVEEPPVALASVPQLHRLQPGVIAAAQVEVRLGGRVGEAVVATLAEAVLV